MLTCDHCDRPTPRGALRDGVCPDCRELAARNEERDRLQAENERLTKRVQRLSEAVGLLNSMVRSGEDHSETSRAVVRQALG